MSSSSKEKFCSKCYKNKNRELGWPEYYIPRREKYNEKFGGAFSISSAVRMPYNRGYYDPNYKQPVYPGVN